MGRRRTRWIGLAIATLALVSVVGFLGWSLTLESVKPRVIEAAYRATGRTLTIAGKMTIGLSLMPTVVMEDVALANPPGFSRPEMVKVARVELSLALLPLLGHRLEVDHVTLERSDIVLETDPAGHPNWVFSRVPGKTAGADDPVRYASAAALPLPVSFKDAAIVDGHIGWIDGKTGRHFEAEAPRLTLDAPSAGAARVTGTIVWQGQTIPLTAQAEGGPFPAISALRVELGSFDLGHGVRLQDLTMSGHGAAPLEVAAHGTWNGVESRIAGTFGRFDWLTAGATGPVSVDLAWTAAAASATVKGTIQAPARFAGFGLELAANLPDPALLIAGAPPGLKAVTFQARLTDAPGAAPFGLTSSAGDLNGELSIARDPRLAVVGWVSSQRLDLDKLRGQPAGRVSPVAERSVEKAAPLIPDTKLPFGLLHAADADITFDFADVRLDGADIRRIDGAVSVRDGRLRLDPFSIAAPDQRLTGLLEVDASHDPPFVHLSVDAPGLAVWPLLTALGVPPAASGTVAVRADLTGTGDSPHAIAASLGGWAGVAMEGGQLDTGMVNSFLGALQPLRTGGGEVSDLRCLAARADAKDGIVTVRPLALSSPALIVEGDGDIDLRQETVSLRLRPRAKLGGTGIALPVRVSGPLRAPSARIDISSKGFGGGLAGLLLGGKDVMGAAGGGDPCPAALAKAREGLSGETK